MKHFLTACAILIFSFGLKAQQDPVDIDFSIEESFQAKSNNYNLDSIGKWHNDALDYLLVRGQQDNLCYFDADFLTKFNGYFADFLETKGLTVQGGLNSVDTALLYPYYDRNICTYEYSFSEEATSILCQLQSALNEFYDENSSIEDLVSACASLINSLDEINDDTEKAIVGSAIAVAKNSSLYWNSKFDTFIETFGCRNQTALRSDLSTTDNANSKGGPNSNVEENYLKPMRNGETLFKKVPWAAVGQADVCGAINGGRVGAVAAGGVPGAIAGGLMGAGIGSGIRLLAFAFFDF